ncbi:MAG: hypothetical protein WC389_00390 [Lutibacter sp.]
MSQNSKRENQNKCYWCGETAIGVEHVPPQNLFPKGHREELIKVYACKKHNQDLSKIDERIRVHMISMSHASEIAQKQFYEKVIRGLKRKESLGLATDLVENQFKNYEGKGYWREKSIYIDTYFEKIIRGLCFYHFELQIKGSTHYFSDKMELINLSANAHFYYWELEKEYFGNWIEGNPKNKKVFDYKYYFSKDESRFFVIMKFYETHKVIGVSIPEGKSIEDYGLDIEKYLNIKLE